MDGFKGDVELNTQLGLARMDLKDWFEPFNDSCLRPPCPDYEATLPYVPVLLERR